jgi:hypothetical protein
MPSHHENLTVRRPDNIKKGDEYLYPHIGGIFHDNIPPGKDALTMHGLTDDATPEVETLETLPVEEPVKTK